MIAVHTTSSQVEVTIVIARSSQVMVSGFAKIWFENVRFNGTHSYRSAAKYSISLISDRQDLIFHSLLCANEKAQTCNEKVCVCVKDTSLKSESKTELYWLCYR